MRFAGRQRGREDRLKNVRARDEEVGGENYKFAGVKGLSFRALDLRQQVFLVSKGFRCESSGSLIGQAWRDAGSMDASIVEAWRKRRYPAFPTNMMDSDRSWERPGNGSKSLRHVLTSQQQNN